MSAISITINREPVHRISYDAASDAAKMQSEIFERLIELEARRHEQGANLCRRLATLADLSPYAFRLVLHVGSGDLSSVLASYEDMTTPRGAIKKTGTIEQLKEIAKLPHHIDARGSTKQAIHYEFDAEIEKIRYMFPEIASVLHSYRDHATRHNRLQSDGESAKDATP